MNAWLENISKVGIVVLLLLAVSACAKTESPFSSQGYWDTGVSTYYAPAAGGFRNNPAAATTPNTFLDMNSVN